MDFDKNIFEGWLKGFYDTIEEYFLDSGGGRPYRVLLISLLAFPIKNVFFPENEWDLSSDNTQAFLFSFRDYLPCLYDLISKYGIEKTFVGISCILESLGADEFINKKFNITEYTEGVLSNFYVIFSNDPFLFYMCYGKMLIDFIFDVVKTSMSDELLNGAIGIFTDSGMLHSFFERITHYSVVEKDQEYGIPLSRYLSLLTYAVGSMTSVFPFEVFGNLVLELRGVITDKTKKCVFDLSNLSLLLGAFWKGVSITPSGFLQSFIIDLSSGGLWVPLALFFSLNPTPFYESLSESAEFYSLMVNVIQGLEELLECGRRELKDCTSGSLPYLLDLETELEEFFTRDEERECTEGFENIKKLGLDVGIGESANFKGSKSEEPVCWKYNLWFLSVMNQILKGFNELRCVGSLPIPGEDFLAVLFSSWRKVFDEPKNVDFGDINTFDFIINVVDLATSWEAIIFFDEGLFDFFYCNILETTDLNVAKKMVNCLTASASSPLFSETKTNHEGIIALIEAEEVDEFGEPIPRLIGKAMYAEYFDLVSTALQSEFGFKWPPDSLITRIISDMKEIGCDQDMLQSLGLFIKNLFLFYQTDEVVQYVSTFFEVFKELFEEYNKEPSLVEAFMYIMMYDPEKFDGEMFKFCFTELVGRCEDEFLKDCFGSVFQSLSPYCNEEEEEEWGEDDDDN